LGYQSGINKSITTGLLDVLEHLGTKPCTQLGLERTINQTRTQNPVIGKREATKLEPKEPIPIQGLPRLLLSTWQLP
jgi:hypothetical protein